MFYVEDLKHFVVSSLEATDNAQRGNRSGHGVRNKAKGVYKAAWGRLVAAGVLSQGEADDIETLIDYRNLVAHQIHNLTSDIARVRSVQIENDKVQYTFDAVQRARDLRQKVSSGMQHSFVLSLSFRGLWFEAAEQTYIEELKRLDRKIRRQVKVERAKIGEANAAVRQLQELGVLEKLGPGHPNKVGRNGKLTPLGIDCCTQLFDAGASAFVVAHLMRLPLRVTTRQYQRWRTAAQRAHG